MAVGAQHVGQDVGIARIAFGGNGAIARPASLDDIRVDWSNNEAGLDEAVDQKAARALDGDRSLAGLAAAAQSSDKLGKPVVIMGYSKAIKDFAGAVEHADGMARSAPVEADENGHVGSPASRSMIPSAGSAYGVLINWRSGPILPDKPVAHLPVARLWLPATATPQVSCGPSRGKRPWPSLRWRGTVALSAIKLIQAWQGEVA